MAATMHIMHGFIGFGKTTFSRKLSQEKSIIRFNNDEWMKKLYGNDPDGNQFDKYWNNINDIQMDIMLKFLQSGIDIIFDNGMWQKSERKAIVKLCIGIGVKYQFYNIECTKETAKERILHRNLIPGDHLFISEETFELKWKFFEPMNQIDENFILIKNIVSMTS